jgi:uncharacterized protein YndB with AHSA1/START domain
MKTPTVHPTTDLIFERTTTLTPAQLWQGWTDPDTLMKWFCPRPWKVTKCMIDLQPGGRFFTLMEGPNGETMPNEGVLLEVENEKALTWTNMMGAGFRPIEKMNDMGFTFTARVTFEARSQGTLYQAHIQHSNANDQQKHAAMGFQEGWGMALTQLEEVFAKQTK